MTNTIDYDQAVTAAEQEASEASSLATALEERVRDGDPDVTPEQLAGARDLKRFADLRVEAARRKAEKARAQAHLDECAALREEIENNRDKYSEKLPDLLRAVDTAVREFVAAVDEHNGQYRDWMNRLHRAGVPLHANISGTQPPAEHANLGYNHAGEILAGPRHVEPIEPRRWLIITLTKIHPGGTLRQAPVIPAPPGNHEYDVFQAIADVAKR